VEIFLDPAHEQCGDQRVYFEHELSPLDVELTIMVPNDGMRFHGWLPWNYSGARRILHATSVIGGNRESMATCKGWRAECFVPFALLSGLSQVPPTGGTRWRGNMFRIDYDDGQPTHWAWDPATGTEFHDYRNFGTLVFE
jgi:hypothetical protein